MLLGRFGIILNIFFHEVVLVAQRNVVPSKPIASTKQHILGVKATTKQMPMDSKSSLSVNQKRSKLKKTPAKDKVKTIDKESLLTIPQVNRKDKSLFSRKQTAPKQVRTMQKSKMKTSTPIVDSSLRKLSSTIINTRRPAYKRTPKSISDSSIKKQHTKHSAPRNQKRLNMEDSQHPVSISSHVPRELADLTQSDNIEKSKYFSKSEFSRGYPHLSSTEPKRPVSNENALPNFPSYSYVLPDSNTSPYVATSPMNTLSDQTSATTATFGRGYAPPQNSPSTTGPDVVQAPGVRSTTHTSKTYGENGGTSSAGYGNYDSSLYGMGRESWKDSATEMLQAQLIDMKPEGMDQDTYDRLLQQQRMATLEPKLETVFGGLMAPKSKLGSLILKSSHEKTSLDEQNTDNYSTAEVGPQSQVESVEPPVANDSVKDTQVVETDIRDQIKKPLSSTPTPEPSILSTSQYELTEYAQVTIAGLAGMAFSIVVDTLLPLDIEGKKKSSELSNAVTSAFLSISMAIANPAMGIPLMLSNITRLSQAENSMKSYGIYAFSLICAIWYFGGYAMALPVLGSLLTMVSPMYLGITVIVLAQSGLLYRGVGWVREKGIMGTLSLAAKGIFSPRESVRNLGRVLWTTVKAIYAKVVEYVQRYYCEASMMFLSTEDRERLISAKAEVSKYYQEDSRIMSMELGQFKQAKEDARRIIEIDDLVDYFEKAQSHTCAVCTYHAIKNVQRFPLIKLNHKKAIIRATNSPMQDGSHLSMLMSLPTFQKHLETILRDMAEYPDLQLFAQYYFTLARTNPEMALQAILESQQRGEWTLPKQKLACVFFRLLTPAFMNDCNMKLVRDQFVPVNKFAIALDIAIEKSRIISWLQNNQKNPNSSIIIVSELAEIFREHLSFIVENKLSNIFDFMMHVSEESDMREISKLDLTQMTPALFAAYLIRVRPNPTQLAKIKTNKFSVEIMILTYGEWHSYQAIKDPETFEAWDTLSEDDFLPLGLTWTGIPMETKLALVHMILSLYFNLHRSQIPSTRPINHLGLIDQLRKLIKDYQKSKGLISTKSKHFLI